MVIRKKTWHYWLWSFTYIFLNENVPGKTGLCSYWWRVLFLSPLILLVNGILTSLAIIIGILTFWIAYTFIAGIMWFVGKKPINFAENILWFKMMKKEGDGLFDSISFNWYRPFKIKSISFYPWHVLVLSAIFGFVTWALFWTNDFMNSLMLSDPHKAMSVVVLGIFILAMIVLPIFLVMEGILKWDVKKIIKEFLTLTRAWLKAKKGKVCPVIEFTE